MDAAIVSSGARVTSDPLPTLPADISIEQVFQNLISNAIKYRRPDVTPKVHISARLESDFWVISVRDNGMGIKQADRANIFQTFRRLHGPEIPGRY